MDGWNTIVSFWGPAYFQGQTVSFWERATLRRRFLNPIYQVVTKFHGHPWAGISNGCIWCFINNSTPKFASCVGIFFHDVFSTVVCGDCAESSPSGISPEKYRLPWTPCSGRYDWAPKTYQANTKPQKNMTGRLGYIRGTWCTRCRWWLTSKSKGKEFPWEFPSLTFLNLGPCFSFWCGFVEHLFKVQPPSSNLFLERWSNMLIDKSFDVVSKHLAYHLVVFFLY